MSPGGAQCAVADVKVSVELLVAEPLAEEQDLAGRPGIMGEQAFEDIHAVVSPANNVGRGEYSPKRPACAA